MGMACARALGGSVTEHVAMLCDEMPNSDQAHVLSLPVNRQVTELRSAIYSVPMSEVGEMLRA